MDDFIITCNDFIDTVACPIFSDNMDAFPTLLNVHLWIVCD